MFSYSEIESLNELEMLVYNYVSANMSQVVEMTIRELAAMSHVSTSTVLRFCRKMHCERYTEFKYRLKEHLANGHGTKANIESADRLIEYFQCVNSVDFAQSILTAAKKIAEKNEIFFLGRGLSAGLCYYASQIFSAIGKFSVSLDPLYLPLVTKFDGSCMAAIVLSVTGEPPELLETVNSLKTAGAAIVTITDAKDCQAAAVADSNIICHMPDASRGRRGIDTMIPLVYTLEMLAETVKKLF